MIANCVPGPMMNIVGRPALYTAVLKILMPTIYGDMKFMATGKESECMAAANAVNSNQLLAESDLAATITTDFNVTELGMVKSMDPYDNTSAYLYVFANEAYRDYEYIANCVPGGVVSSLEQTAGKPALYTVALQTILPSLMGDLQYLGEGPCGRVMNKINEGNTSVLPLLKDHDPEFEGMDELGILQGLDTADNKSSYLYVFKNKMWNETWGVMTGRRLSPDIVA
eukprot:CAMPEP_0197621000 /NCGR_PEP_ID=MMETSP1338-20131121/1665_1 /TAXON_ID=43686 ORGANISM="Pelagodinium beii, Strain RCC1491" /NCGR_SAMPLE_ID=MMETSP1338 /ASSEMBLY_ACC=CAM_ASM_000754 /LENGTH=225 /DNA_ID=CAMNT_0043190319 /DNA_START=125 /DNA_END=802 /DNA_ORIENTATION=+